MRGNSNGVRPIPPEAKMRGGLTPLSTPTRLVATGSARSLLLTLLGEFVLPKDRPVWTSTLLSVLVGVGVAEKSARQAIARAAAADWIESRKEGRRVSWTLTPHGRRLIASGSARVSSMSHGGALWNGQWLVLMITLPATHRELRVKLYRALHWAGFGNPSAGLWINPHTERIDEARKLVASFGVSELSYAFVGSALDFGVGDPQLVAQSWDLQSVSEHYEALLTRFGKVRRSTADAILCNHVLLANARQRLPFIDPGLPSELLPARWSGRKAAARLEALRDDWREAAHARWDELARQELER
jgi:phenylacetic acid degradation operon negative regulatory protein